jgi:POT family proton-dependent oligopeptide transporter
MPNNLKVIFIPIMDFFIYPALRKARIHFTPIKRITWGFFIASAAMISSAVLQSYIYKLSACPDNHVNDGVWPVDGEDTSCIAPINVWVQAVPYCLIAFSEIFASITSLEYAFSKAPENMRGVVMGVNLLQTAFSSAIGQALVPLADDPLLIWNYTVVAILAALGGKQFWMLPALHDKRCRYDYCETHANLATGVGFWFTWRSLDAKEDELNMIQATQYMGRKASMVDLEKEEGIRDAN